MKILTFFVLLMACGCASENWHPGPAYPYINPSEYDQHRYWGGTQHEPVYFVQQRQAK